jgi:hypothetical protein
VTYGTALARAGVRLQEAQRLMRHSSPVLTANVYTRLELHDLRRARERIGSRLTSRPSGVIALHVPSSLCSEQGDGAADAVAR